LIEIFPDKVFQLSSLSTPGQRGSAHCGSGSGCAEVALPFRKLEYLSGLRPDNLPHGHSPKEKGDDGVAWPLPHSGWQSHNRNNGQYLLAGRHYFVIFPICS
jgi:hypothetical protein